jgi:hypothetical protein
MDKNTLNEALEAYKKKVQEAFQTVYDGHNEGQKKKLLKNETIKEIFDTYGVKT